MLKLRATETKPGVRTTEFWLAIFTAAVGFVPASGLMDYLPQSTGAALMKWAAVGYAIARGLAKLGVAYDQGNSTPTDAPDPALTRR